MPSEIRLTNERGLSGWHADYYRESYGPDGYTSREDQQSAEPAWTKQADEIVGSLLAQADGSYRESLLQYHRPLSEDCVMEYEFFWDAGKVECHPALDRLAILLSAEGVQTHQMTDGPLDRAGIAADNRTALTGSKPVALKARNWNRARITLNQSRGNHRGQRPGRGHARPRFIEPARFRSVPLPRRIRSPRAQCGATRQLALASIVTRRTATGIRAYGRKVIAASGEDLFVASYFAGIMPTLVQP